MDFMETLSTKMDGISFSPRSFNSDNYHERKRLEKGDYTVLRIESAGGARSTGVWANIQYHESKEIERVPVARLAMDEQI